MLATEILKLLHQRGPLGDTEIADSLSSFGLLSEDHSAMHPGMRHPRYRVSTVSLDEVTNVLRVMAQLDLVAGKISRKTPVYKLTERGEGLLREL